MSINLLTIPEVARILNVREDRVYQLVREQILPAVHLGRQIRVNEAKLLEFIDGGGQSYPGGWKKEA